MSSTAKRNWGVLDNFFKVFRMGYDKTASKVGVSQRIQFRGISPTFLKARPYRANEFAIGRETHYDPGA